MPRAPEEISPWICLCSAGHSVGLLGLHYSDPTYRISRDTQFLINSPVTKPIIQVARHTRSFIKSHRICLDKWTFSPTPARWHTGFFQVGKCTRVMRYIGAAAESARGRGRRNRMESAAALIGSQPCDVFIACLGCRQGQVTIGLILVNGSGGTSGGGWRSCGDFFSFFLLGMREGGRCGPYPRTCHS